MKSIKIKLFCLCILLFSFGCNKYVTIQNVPTTKITSDRPLSKNAVRNAIMQAGYKLNMSMKEINNNLIRAEYKKNKFSASMNIYYTADDFSIQYNNSYNLKNKDGLINKNYNRWVQNLKLEIEKTLRQNLYK